MNVEDALAKIEEYEKKGLPTPPPLWPELEEEPCERIMVHCAFGGWWGYVRYADGSISKKSFRQMPTPKGTKAYEEKYESVRKLHEDYRTQLRIQWETRRLLSGSARNAITQRKAFPRTVEECMSKIARSTENTHTYRYIVEFLFAVNTVSVLP